MTKVELAEKITGFFQTQPDNTFSLKQIFRALKLSTHPLKMLAIDVMEEMAWDDFLSKVGENAYTLNTKGQVQEGVFVRKSNGKNSFLPDDGGTPIFISERNSMSALNGDRVKVQYFARRRNHIKEGMVIEIFATKEGNFCRTFASRTRNSIPYYARKPFCSRYSYSKESFEWWKNRR